MPYIPPKAMPYEARVRWYRYVYLKTPHWKITRQMALINAGRMCEYCSTKKKLQVHHLTYDRLYAELSTDLMVLCEKCHKKAERIKFKGSTDVRRVMTLRWLNWKKGITAFLANNKY